MTTDLVSRRQLLVDGARRGLGGLCSGAALAPAAGDRHVFVWLRGGADALSLVVPYRNDEYYRARPQTALLPPGRGTGAALRLTADFGLHPGLAPLLPTFAEGEASIVWGVGQPTFTASHAEAERALLGALRRSWGLSAHVTPKGCLGEQLGTLAARIRSGAAPRVALVEASGWDTHAAQGRGLQGLLASSVDELACALRDFRIALGSARRQVRVVVGSEFGRSLRETTLAGTDDGHASLSFVFDTSSRASAFVGSVPALGPRELSQGRHLRPTRMLEDLLTSCLASGGRG